MKEEPTILDQLLPVQFVDGTNLAAKLNVSRSLSIGRGQVAAFLYSPKMTYTLARIELCEVGAVNRLKVTLCASFLGEITQVELTSGQWQRGTAGPEATRDHASEFHWLKIDMAPFVVISGKQYYVRLEPSGSRLRLPYATQNCIADGVQFNFRQGTEWKPRSQELWPVLIRYYGRFLPVTRFLPRDAQ